jgi:hypothetical protein
LWGRGCEREQRVRACAFVRPLSSRAAGVSASLYTPTLYTLGDGVVGATPCCCTQSCAGVRVGAVGQRAWPLRPWPRGRRRLLAADQPDPERTGCHVPASPRATRYLGADGVSAARGAPRGACGSRVTASRYALGAEGVWALRARAPICVCSPGCTRCLLGMVLRDVDDVVRCALLERLGARHASSSCRGRGWGGTPREAPK